MAGASSSDPVEGQVYEFRVRGELSADWSEWFDGFEVVTGGGETLLRGSIRDEAALYGMIAKFRNLGLVLLSLSAIPSVQELQHPGSRE